MPESIEIQMAEVKKDISYLREETAGTRVEIKSLHAKMDTFIESANSKFADKEQFVFWRNILVSGLLVTITVGVFMIIIKQ